MLSAFTSLIHPPLLRHVAAPHLELSDIRMVHP
jgi:hypothetical protein